MPVRVKDLIKQLEELNDPDAWIWIETEDRTWHGKPLIKEASSSGGYALFC